jgi:hypothetical protein
MSDRFYLKMLFCIKTCKYGDNGSITLGVYSCGLQLLLNTRKYVVLCDSVSLQVLGIDWFEMSLSQT